MKKLISSLVIGGILASSVLTFAETTSWTATKASFKVMVRGEEFISENPAIVVEGRTYLPLRAMGDALGVNVEWNAELKQAEVAMSTKAPSDTGPVKPSAEAANAPTSWTATKASFKVMVRGAEFVSENPAIVVEGRTYLPLRAMGGALGVDVEWNESLRQAEVAMKTPNPDTTPAPSTTPDPGTAVASATPAPGTSATPEKTSAVSAAETISIDIGSVEAKAGETVNIPITISNISEIGISTSDFVISFNNNILEYDGVTAGDIVKNPEVNFAANIDSENASHLMFLYLDYTMQDGSIDTNGLFATIKFKVKEDAKVGENIIELTGSPTFGDPLLATMKVEFKAGTVTVVE